MQTIENTLSELFQSTLPVGGATLVPEDLRNIVRFQSTLPVGGATVLHERLRRTHKYFNPRSPWGERHICISMSAEDYLFQSTLPVGGATSSLAEYMRIADISIHAPRGGSDPFSAYGTYR